MVKMKALILCLLVSSICVAYTSGLAVMSIDLGMEFMKIAIVKPGVPMEIALNKDSRRKTNVAVSFDRDDRLFGDAAMVKSVRVPKQAYLYLQDVLGKTKDNPGVERFHKRFPYYELEEDPERKTITFKHNDDTVYTPEELMAMILETAKETASEFAEQPITDAVITVPPFFNQVERRAMLRAADIAGVKVLQLMNDNTATALNYGVFRRKAFNSTAVNYMFFDMGSGSTTATVVSYQVAKVKNPVTERVETNPQLTIKGVGYDRTLGGIEFNYRLRDHLVHLFNQKKKTKSDVTQNARSMAKLYKEANRVKQVLSANTEHYAQIEGLLDEEDFRSKVSRAEFEAMCGDLFARIVKPVEDAMKSSQLTWDEITEVILMGGGTRMPRVQEILQEVTRRKDLGRSINTDEAAAMGAVYQAAHLSKGFRVKPFPIKDATVFPVQVQFERVKTGEDGAEASKTVKRTLFGRMNSFPQKKVMTFNKHVKDFSFVVNYGDLSFMSEAEKKEFGSTQIHKVSLSGVGTAYDKHKENKDNKGVKAHFRMDDSGILSLDKVESVFELPPDAEPEVAEESTLQKLGSFFFGSSDKDGEKADEDGTADEPKEEIKAEKDESAGETMEKTEKAETEEPEQKEKEEKQEKPPKEEKKDKKKKKAEKEPKEEEKTDKKEENKEESTTDKKEKKGKKEKSDTKAEEEKTAKEKTTEEKSQTKSNETKESETKSEESKGENKEEKKPAKPTIIKEEIGMEVTVLDLIDPTSDDIKISKKKLTDLMKRDQEKRALAAVKNDLESYIIEGQDRLYQEKYEQASTSEEREEIQGKLSAASDWLYEQDEVTDKKSYEDKLSELKKALSKLYGRVKEHDERPRAIEALNSVMNYSKTFLKTMKNFTGEDQPFTETEYNTLSKLIQDTREWNKTQMADQANTPLYEKPKVMVEDIARKVNDLDREVKYLINKAKVYKPKPKKAEKKTNDTKTEEKSEKGGNDAKSNETIIETEETKTEDMKEETKDGEFKVPERVLEETDSNKSKKTDKEAETTDEEPLQLDGKVEAPTEDKNSNKKSEDKKDDKTTHGHGHDPDDEL